ncbi:MAG: hypothetical protein PHX43_05895 [Alphaproteobacteria bacterium]|nr:hypothetical protein [Alphaproteobacteria bacterium]
MRFFLLILIFVAVSSVAWAVEAPSGQARIDASKILRGRFVEEHHLAGVQKPMQSSGHFVVAPAYGLIWGIETPFPTSTIITQNGAVQDLGGIAMKLPVKNLHQLYDMVGRALAGDWSGLETAFVIKRSTTKNRWKMLLTPRQTDKPALPYAEIAISGGRFVENIVMTKNDGRQDMLGFSDEVMSSAQLTAGESAAFNKIKQ